MKKIALLTCALCAIQAQASLKVVTTTADLASIASAIGGKNVSVSSLITGSRDAHHIEAKPSYISRVAGADVFIANGLDLEVGYEGAILDGARNRKVIIGASGHIYASEFAYVLEKPTRGVTRADGDIHPDGNPHIMLDPYNGRQVAIGIARRFQSIDAANAKVYESNLSAFLSRLDTAMFGSGLVNEFGGSKLWQWHNAGNFESTVKRAGAKAAVGGWASKAKGFAGIPVFSYHRSLPYLARRFGLNVIGQLEPKPGLEPTPGHLATLIRTGRERGVKAILQEPFFSNKAAKTVAGQIGAKVVLIPQSVGQASGANDYISLFDVIISNLGEAL